MRAVFRILRLALGGEGRLGEVAGEQQSRQQEGGAQSGVEKCDEPVRGHAAGPQPDAAGHHHCHDDEGLHIEKLEEEVQLLLVGADAGRVFVHQPSENEDLEYGEYNGGQQIIDDRAVGRADQQADAQNVPQASHVYAQLGHIKTDIVIRLFQAEEQDHRAYRVFGGVAYRFVDNDFNHHLYVRP